MAKSPRSKQREQSQRNQQGELRRLLNGPRGKRKFTRRPGLRQSDKRRRKIFFGRSIFRHTSYNNQRYSPYWFFNKLDHLKIPIFADKCGIDR
jgi:hypothetical protein